MKKYLSVIILMFIYTFNITNAAAVETNLSPEMYEYLLSHKTSGPSGSLYESFGTNFIFKRTSYDESATDFVYKYPDRLALPTRLILPVENNESCFSCHRIDYPAIASGEDIHSIDIMYEGISVTSLTFDNADDILPTWSSKNDIFWLSDRSGSYQLWVMDSMGNNKRQLTNENGDVVYYDVSEDGNSVVYSASDEANPSFNIKVLNFSSDIATEIISSENIIDRPELSPDGGWIAYSQKNDTNWDIFVIPIEGGNPIRLTTSENIDTNPRWSPDGTIIAYKTAPVSGDYNLTTQNFIQFNSDNGELEKIYHWEGVQSIQMSDWRPDGSGIVYTAEIVRYVDSDPLVTYTAVYSDVVLRGDKAVAYPIMLSENTIGDRGAVFSPVNDKIAYWSWEADGTSAIRVYDPVAEKSTKITESGLAFYPSWSPDGEKIIFESSTNNQRDIKIIDLSQTVN